MDLDNLDKIRELDRSDVADPILESISLFPKQANQAWKETKKLEFPKEYSQIKNIFIIGMGGSGFTPEMVKFLYKDKFTIPCEVQHGYDLPKYVNKDSLVILSSYSGTTREVLDAGIQALKKGLKLTGITRGDGLSKFMLKNNIPGYIFDEIQNPSKQPRLGSGYMIIGIIGILNRCRLLNLDSNEVRDAVNFVKNFQKTLSLKGRNIANLVRDKIPIIVVSEFLEGNGRGMRNQFNENAKNFAEYQTIPELNHHLMEGLKFPKLNEGNLIFLFINSKLYHRENQKRYKVTQEVVKRNNIETINFELSGKTKLQQALELFSLGSYTTYYLSRLNKVDPQKIFWVDYFKKKLAS